MRRAPSTHILRSSIAMTLLVLAGAPVLGAQQTPPAATAFAPVPRLVWFSGTFQPADGQPPQPVETVTVAVYRDREGGEPVWQETQTVPVRAGGRYDILLGSTMSDGMPLDLFTAGEPRWIGVRVLRGGEIEQPRVHLASVPYALKAADAETLGGKPMSAFVLAEPTPGRDAPADTRSPNKGRVSSSPVPAVAGTGTTNQVTKWVDTAGTLADSAITEVGGQVGIGTISPGGTLHLFGVPNTDVFAGMGPDLINGPAFNFGYAGGSIGRSVGFFNVRPDASAVAPNPSLRFLTGNVQRMIVTNTGNVGVGVASPAHRLSLSTPSNFGLRVETNSPGGQVASFGGFGDFQVDANGIIGGRLTAKENGNVGIGNASPAAKLDVAGDINMTGTLNQNGTSVLRTVFCCGNLHNTSLGAGALPDFSNGSDENTAIGSNALQGNIGYQNTAIGDGAMGSNFSGDENTAVGWHALRLNTTGSGNIAIGVNAALHVNGSNFANIHIGNEGSANDLATVRIGDNYHVKFFVGGVRGVTTASNDAVPVLIDSAGQLGTVNSSRRYKEDIHDMGDASRGLLRLRPVTFRYRKAFDDGSKPIQYGLIAEEVAEVYPDLVARSADGQIEAVRYQLLDVLLLNELQRQQTEIQALTQQNRDLRRRLERLEATKSAGAATRR